MRLSKCPVTPEGQIPRQIGEIVALNGGSNWGLLLDVEGDTCTFGVKERGKVRECTVPCQILHHVHR